MEYLENLLKTESFETAVDSLIHEFRNKYELPTINQLGLVVADVEKAAEYLERKGIGPFFIGSGKLAFWYERGERRSVKGKLGTAQYQGVELELLEPTEGSDFYKDSLDPQGKIIVHHLAFLVEDVAYWVKRFEEEGFPVWIQGRINYGPLRIDFVYMDTESETGYVIEFFSQRFFGLKWWPPAGFFRTLAKFQT